MGYHSLWHIMGQRTHNYKSITRHYMKIKPTAKIARVIYKDARTFSDLYRAQVIAHALIECGALKKRDALKFSRLCGYNYNITL